MKQLLIGFTAIALVAISALAADFVIYPVGITTVTCGTSAGCPGGYCGYANYTRTVSQGWGWKPHTNGNTVFTATDTNRNDTKVQFVGKSLDAGCNQTSVTIPNPPQSVRYRFTVYFTNNVPGNTNYPLVLSGFDP